MGLPENQTQKKDNSNKSKREWLKSWFYRDTVLPHKKLLCFFLGFIAAILPLATRVISESRVTWIFLGAFALYIFALLIVRPSRFSNLRLSQTRWGLFSVLAVSYGLGALSYRYRAWFSWLWSQFRRINEPYEWILVSLFLVGVVLGFFVVRNWNKEQKDFVGSLTAVFGAAFISTILGNLADTPQLEAVTTFAFYALGFSLSGTLNLIAFALLVGHYSRTESTTSRSVIDFLYGSDKAKAIDGYFLKNFEEDPNYAKAKLFGALSAYREIIKNEFATKMSIRRKEQKAPSNIGTPPALCSPSPPAPPLDYFELLSIKSKPSDVSQAPSASDEIYEVLFRKLHEDESITPQMFRVAISMRWQENLEYIVAPGQYQKAFPYSGSVAGLALTVKQTIVMDRDKYKKFRSKDFVEGKTPNEADQPRGLHKIDYLSYICVPMSSSFGKQEETALGVLHLDTKLFACEKGSLPPDSCRQLDPDSNQEIFKVERKRDQLDEFAKYACNLYQQSDECIKNLESFRDVIVPLLELYLKCRTGAR